MRSTIHPADVDHLLHDAGLLAHSAKVAWERTTDSYAADIMDLVDELTYVFSQLEEAEDFSIIDIHDVLHTAVIDHFDNYHEGIDLLAILRETEERLWHDLEQTHDIP